ncbi:MAG: Tropinesterase [Planctomycetes bacterium]|nr:Tropinesterase [Planctomycetota bacterium]
MHGTHLLPDGRSLVYDWRPAPLATSHAPPPVAFLNGLSQTTVAWGLQAQRMKGRRSVLLHDAAGQGRSSPPPEGHRPAGHARDLLHLADALGIGAFDLVGFSYGSRIALRFALLAPERVRKLVLVGCAHRDTTARRWIVRSWADALRHGGLEHAFRVVTPMVMGDRWLARNEKSEAEMVRAFTRRNTQEGMSRLLADTLLPGGGLGEELRTIRRETLVIRGEEDLVVSAALNRELVSLLPRARYAECEGVGHTVAIESPDWFADTLESFLG